MSNTRIGERAPVDERPEPALGMIGRVGELVRESVKRVRERDGKRGGGVFRGEKERRSFANLKYDFVGKGDQYVEAIKDQKGKREKLRRSFAHSRRRDFATLSLFASHFLSSTLT